MCFKKTIFIFVICVLILTLTFRFFPKQPTVWQPLAHAPDHSFVTLELPQKLLKVELVNTESSRIQGLSGRKALGSDGMLFVYSQPQQAFFWMKDMQFDLDLVWLRHNKIIALIENVPHSFKKNENLPIYTVKQPVDAVLEVPAGKVHDWGIKKGAVIKIY